MVDVKDKRCARCGKIATFTHSASGIVLCVFHATTSDIAPEELAARSPYRRCAQCGRWAHINSPKTRCMMCDPSSVVHRKETRVVKALEKDGWELTHDRRLECTGGCTQERPDVLIDLGHRVLIVEVDEHQHESYPADCELTRMGRLAQDLGGPPVVFLRWNPDAFRVDGVLQRVKWVQRYAVLVAWLNHMVSCPLHVNAMNYEVVYLFYDDEIVSPPPHNIKE